MRRDKEMEQGETTKGEGRDPAVKKKEESLRNQTAPADPRRDVTKKTPCWAEEARKRVGRGRRRQLSRGGEGFLIVPLT